MLATLLFSTTLNVPRCAAPRMQLTIEKVSVPAHEKFLSDVALVMPPSALASVAGLLVSRGEELVEPGVDASLHPLLVPLTKSADGAITGLLRWPTASGGGSKLPLVRTTADGKQLTLLANSAENFLLRAAAIADAEGSSDAESLASLAAGVGWPYKAGEAAASAGGLPGYLLTKVGPFVQEYESLAEGHLKKGSETSALVTCERSQACFGAWGRPFAFHARMLTTIGDYEEEARDKARSALELPLWTLGDELSEVVKLAQTDMSSLKEKVQLKSEGKLTTEQLRAQNGMEKRTPSEIAKDRASYLLDLAVVSPEEYSWESVREPLAELYTKAGMGSIAAFVKGPSE